MPAPAFQFYPDDFVGSGVVQAAQADEIGAYVLLLCLDWGEDGFAYDERRLARVCRLSVRRFRKVWSHLSDKFPRSECDNKHRNPRLQKERHKQAEWRLKSSSAGRKGADARWNPADGGDGQRHATAMTTAMRIASPNHGSPVSSLQSPVTTTTTTPLLPKPPAKADPRPNWPAAVAETWVRRVGVIREGRVGKDLQPFVRLYPSGEAAVGAIARAVEIYADLCTRRAQKPAWADFVRGVQGYVPATMLPPERAA